MPLTAAQRAKLSALARAAVQNAVKGQSLPQAEPLEGVLAQPRGCFVTLTNCGRLRGCIGTFHPDRPLGQMVVAMGEAATQDPRFLDNRVTPGELPDLTIEVSVLSPLELTRTPEKLQIGTHGIYIVYGHRAGCFLPEVATEMGWGVEQFLDECCSHKAGLPPGAWRKPEAQVYLFTSEKFTG